MVAFVLDLKVLELVVLGLLLVFLNLGSQSFYLFVIKLGINVQQLDLKSLVDSFQFVNFIALLHVFLPKFIVFDFELLKNPNLSFDLLLWLLI